MITHILTRKWQRGGESLSKTETLTADGENNRDVNIPANASNHTIEFALDVSQLQSLYLVASQDCVITPYDTGDTPMTAVDLAKDIPFVWTSGSGLDNPFASDIGSLHVANGSASEVALLSLRCLLDSTASNAVGS